MKRGCSVDMDHNDCCRYEIIMHSIPHINENGTRPPGIMWE